MEFTLIKDANTSLFALNSALISTKGPRTNHNSKLIEKPINQMNHVEKVSAKIKPKIILLFRRRKMPAIFGASVRSSVLHSFHLFFVTSCA